MPSETGRTTIATHAFFNKMLQLVMESLENFDLFYFQCFFHSSPPVLRLHLGPFSIITFIFIKAYLPCEGHVENSYANKRVVESLFCFKHAFYTYRLGLVTSRNRRNAKTVYHHGPLARQGYG